jgi:hypothetical protein
LKTHDDFRMIALLLAAAILLGGMPIVSGAPQALHPAFGIDVCQPVQAVNRVSATCSLPILADSSIVQTLEERGRVPAAAPMVVISPGEAPDPPPPKILV